MNVKKTRRHGRGMTLWHATLLIAALPALSTAFGCLLPSGWCRTVLAGETCAQAAVSGTGSAGRPVSAEMAKARAKRQRQDELIAELAGRLSHFKAAGTGGIV